MCGRAVLAACAVLGALGWAGGAGAAYVPRLVVGHAAVTGTSVATTISFQLTRDDDATAKVTFYVPLGYRGVLGQPAGTQLGTVQASVQALRVGPDAVLPLAGVVRADDPARHGASPCSPGIHGAVWLLLLEAAGRTLTVPVYVDAVTAGPEAAFAQFRLEVCLPPPDVPEEQGGAAFGTTLLSATLQLRSGLLTTPATRGRYAWPGLFTPYAAGGRPNVAATVEARAIVRLPGRLTLTGRITSRRTRTISLSGALTEHLVGLPQRPVDILVGGRRAFGIVTGRDGGFALALRRRGQGRVTSTFRARARVPARDVTAAECAGPSLAAAGCVTATASAFTVLSRAVRITL